MIRSGGRFEVKFDDGTLEGDVHRHRLLPLYTPSSSYNAQDEESSAAVQLLPTVQPSNIQLGAYPWQLVYRGPLLSYTISGLIPSVLLDSEPGLEMSIMVALQVEGLDGPPGERSQLSRPLLCHTRSNSNNTDNLSVATLTAAVDDGKSSIANTADEEVSRTRKRIIEAIVIARDNPYIEPVHDHDNPHQNNSSHHLAHGGHNSHQQGQEPRVVRLEQRDITVWAEGIGEDYA